MALDLHCLILSYINMRTSLNAIIWPATLIQVFCSSMAHAASRPTMYNVVSSTEVAYRTAWPYCCLIVRQLKTWKGPTKSVKANCMCLGDFFMVETVVLIDDIFMRLIFTLFRLLQSLKSIGAFIYSTFCRLDGLLF